MSLRSVFLLSIAAGAVIAVIYLRSPARIDRDAIPKPEPAAESSTDTGSAKEERLGGSAPLSQPRSPESAATAPPARADELVASEKTQKTAARLAANETLTREQLHGMLSRTFEGKLHDRELTPSDYDRLADAILKIRASQRVLNGVPDTEQNAQLRGTHEAAIKSAFADVQNIVGIAPSALGSVLGEGEAGSPEEPNEDVGRSQ